MLIKTVLWTIIYIVWDFFYLGWKFDPKLTFEEPVRVHFWFMYVIVGIYATIPFWQKLVQGASKELIRYFTWLFIGITAISFTIRMLKMSISYAFPLVGASCYACLFIMGYVIRHYIDEIHIKKWISVAVIILCAAATTALTLITSLKTGSHVESFSGFKSIFIVLSAMSLFYLFMKAKSLKPYKWMSVISKYSFGIYMTHVFFLDILQENLDVTKINAWIGTPLFFIIMLLASLGFTWLYEKAQGKNKIL